MPRRDDKNEEAIKSLDERLDAFQASRAKSNVLGANRAMGDGYRLLAELIGGVLCGAAVGFGVDYLAHTSPWGIAGGIAVGAGVSVYLAVHSAQRMGAKAMSEGGVAQPAPADDDDD
jgi:ATP synthase protein I